MSDVLSIASFAIGLTGVTFKDAVAFVQALKQSSESEYKAFAKGIYNTVKASCKQYVKYCKASHEHLQYGFVRKQEDEITSNVLLALQQNIPFTMNQMLPKETDLPYHERKLLHQIICTNLNKSLQYCMRDFKAWTREREIKLIYSVKEMTVALVQLRELGNEIHETLRRINQSWPVEKLTKEWYDRQRKSAQDNRLEYIKEYYSVSDRFNTMSGIVCAELDYPNVEALAKAQELLERFKGHLFIIGNGGEGKTTLMLRLAVKQMLEGHLCYWLRLRRCDLSIADITNASVLLDSIDREAKSHGTTALLFLDNIMEGQKMLEALSSAWKHEYSIWVVFAERTNNVMALSATNDNKMKVWNDAAYLCFHSSAEVQSMGWLQNYCAEPVSLQWKLGVIREMIQTNEEIDRDRMQYALARAEYRSRKKEISLVELMLITYLEYNRDINISRKYAETKSIKLAWDEWEEQIQSAFPGFSAGSFCAIAAMDWIGMELTADSFIEYYDPSQKVKFIRYIQELAAGSDTLPVLLTEHEGSLLLAPKHDMIADLYFTYCVSEDYFTRFMNQWLNTLPISTQKADTMMQIAHWNEERFKYQKAIELYLEAATLSEITYGEEHLNTETTYNNVAKVFHSNGEFDKALVWYRKALALCDAVLGEKHPLTAATYNNIAAVYDSKGEYAKALEWFQMALAIKEKALEPEDPSIATAYSNIATVYCNMGEYDKALGLYYKALIIIEKVLGKEHLNTAMAANNIALVYCYMGEYDKALEWYGKALAIKERVLGKVHPDTALTYNNIAGIYENKGEHDTALEWYGKALVICEALLGKEHLNTATTYNNAAGSYQSKGENNKALEWYGKALRIYEAVLGKRHPDTAMTYNNIATVYYSMGMLDAALEWYDKALAVREDVLGIMHPETAATYNNIAAVYDYMGEYDKALEWCKKGSAISEAVLGKEHPDTATAYNNIARIYARKEEYRIAHGWFIRALDIMLCLGREHPNTQAILENLYLSYLESGGSESDFPAWLAARLAEKGAAPAAPPSDILDSQS